MHFLGLFLEQAHETQLMDQLAQRQEEEQARRAEEGRALSELDSTRAFAAFLAKRKNYSVPAFLEDVIQVGKKVARFSNYEN